MSGWLRLRMPTRVGPPKITILRNGLDIRSTSLFSVVWQNGERSPYSPGLLINRGAQDKLKRLRTDTRVTKEWSVVDRDHKE